MPLLNLLQCLPVHAWLPVKAGTLTSLAAVDEALLAVQPVAVAGLSKAVTRARWCLDVAVRLQGA